MAGVIVFSAGTPGDADVVLPDPPPFPGLAGWTHYYDISQVQAGIGDATDWRDAGEVSDPLRRAAVDSGGPLPALFTDPTYGTVMRLQGAKLSGSAASQAPRTIAVLIATAELNQYVMQMAGVRFRRATTGIWQAVGLTGVQSGPGAASNTSNMVMLVAAVRPDGISINIAGNTSASSPGVFTPSTSNFQAPTLQVASAEGAAAGTATLLVKRLCIWPFAATADQITAIRTKWLADYPGVAS